MLMVIIVLFSPLNQTIRGANHVILITCKNALCCYGDEHNVKSREEWSRVRMEQNRTILDQKVLDCRFRPVFKC